MSAASNGQGPNFTDSPEKAGRLEKLKKAATFVVGVSAGVVIVLLLLGFTNQGNQIQNGDFVIQIDSPDAANHFSMGIKPGASEGEEPSESNSILYGTPLGNAVQTTNAKIREQYEDLLSSSEADGGPSGSNNFVNDQGDPSCLVYTFYLTNASKTEEQAFHLAARLNTARGQSDDAVGIDVYEYCRLGLFIGDDGKEDDTVRYFAHQNSKSVPTEEGPQDYRECLSEYRRELDSDGNYYRIPTYSDTYVDAESKSTAISYCENFVTNGGEGYEDRGLFDIEETIKAGTSRRITFVAYLEGYDPDGSGVLPKNQRLGFSLHIGI